MNMVRDGLRSFSSRVTRFFGCIRVDVAALEKIIESADTIPAVAIAFHQKPVPAARAGSAMVLRQEIDEEIIGFAV